MKRFRYFLIISVVSLSIAGCKSKKAGKYYLLRLQPEMGKEYQMKMNLDMDMKAMGMGTSMDMLIDMSMEGKAEGEDRVDIEIAYNRIKMDMEIPTIGSVTYDSDIPDSNGGMISELYNELFGGMIDKPHLIVFNQLGKIIDYSSLDDLLGGLQSENTNSQVDIGQFYDNMFALFPEDSITIGDSWENEVVTKSKMPFLMKVEYTLSAVEGNEAILSFEGNLELNKDKANLQGANFKKMEGTYKGETHVDLNSGMTLSATVNQNMKIEVESFGLAMPMNIETSISISTE